MFGYMKKVHKYLYIALTVVLSVMFVIINLFKGVAVRGGDPFSLSNISKIGFIFLIGIPIVFLVNKFFTNNKRKDDNVK